jgi:hypothetical protein
MSELQKLSSPYTFHSYRYRWKEYNSSFISSRGTVIGAIVTANILKDEIKLHFLQLSPFGTFPHIPMHTFNFYPDTPGFEAHVTVLLHYVLSSSSTLIISIRVVFSGRTNLVVGLSGDGERVVAVEERSEWW